ncbi:hypothetical protein OQX61_20425 [Pedobacter sp. PLR]|uniref:hypothetical protein n=1 Tax=Pedobacter sp. PLR TaxID=2994465 RepID=UPI002246DE53|nr:hypothetical protein [Pedobacter sp. PLR]MCX2453649.1 hypothetical protein [Pedobacter sp. PLR]
MQDSTILHRQVHPSLVQDNKFSSKAFEIGSLPVGQIASSVFVPKDSDNNQLSVYNGDKFSAEESHDHYIEKLDSAGVVSVSVEECISIDLTATEDNLPFDGHSFIDFITLNKSQAKIKAKKLKAMAVARDWTFKK